VSEEQTLFAPGDEVAGDAADRTFSVGQLNQAITHALGDAFPSSVWVRGEIQQLSTSRNGHTYFELVEKDGARDRVRAVLRVALFRGDRPGVNRALQETGLRLGDGVEVRIQGRVDYWPPAGRLQLVMHAIDPVFTVGRLAADRERLLRALAAEGILGRNGTLEMAPVPLRVGLVASRNSAAFRDFLHGLEATPYAFRVAHGDVRVQGGGASRRVAFALRRLAELDLDVVVVIRGGGARSDLAAFDSEIVARAITEMPVPVVTGIGHEVDRTVADDVAHTCAKTPTAAAAELVARVDAYCDRLAHLSHRVSLRARSCCVLETRALADVARRVERGAPVALERERHRLARAHAQVLDAGRRGTGVARTALATRERSAVAAGRRALRDRTVALDGAAARLRALDPRRVLERGYSITRGRTGALVRTPDQVEAGDLLVTETAGGALRSTVVDVASDDR
jgi:exodeoxyribonuclease VII large subunit